MLDAGRDPALEVGRVDDDEVLARAAQAERDHLPPGVGARRVGAQPASRRHRRRRHGGQRLAGCGRCAWADRSSPEVSSQSRPSSGSRGAVARSTSSPSTTLKPASSSSARRFCSIRPRGDDQELRAGAGVRPHGRQRVEARRATTTAAGAGSSRSGSSAQVVVTPVRTSTRALSAPGTSEPQEAQASWISVSRSRTSPTVVIWRSPAASKLSSSSISSSTRSASSEKSRERKPIFCRSADSSCGQGLALGLEDLAHQGAQLLTGHSTHGGQTTVGPCPT